MGLWCFCQRARVALGGRMVLVGALKYSGEVIRSQGHLLLLQGCHAITQGVVNSIYQSLKEFLLVSMDGT